MPTSPDTLLHLLKKPRVNPSSVQKLDLKVISVDDFAFKRGRTYGTIILNLETHRPVELLPDRSATTLAAWLKLHGEIEIVSRDRSTEYARGASEVRLPPSKLLTGGTYWITFGKPWNGC